MRKVRIGVLAAFGVLMAIVLSPAEAAPKTTRVMQRSFEFMPERVDITVGERVTWTYDERPTDLGCEFPALQLAPGGCPGHSVTSFAKKKNGKPLFDSGVHRADGFPFTVTFTKPGTYRYYCIPHGGPNETPLMSMDGVVVVHPKGHKR